MEEIATTNDGCVKKNKLLFFLRIFEVMVPDIYLELGKYCRLVQMKHGKFTSKASDNKDMSEDRSANKTEIYAILEESLQGADKIRECPEPYQGAFKITNKFIDDAKQNGRK